MFTVGWLAPRPQRVVPIQPKKGFGVLNALKNQLLVTAFSICQLALTASAQEKSMPSITDLGGVVTIDGTLIADPAVKSKSFQIVALSTPTAPTEAATIFLVDDDDGGQTLKIRFTNGTVTTLAQD